SPGHRRCGERCRAEPARLRPSASRRGAACAQLVRHCPSWVSFLLSGGAAQAGEPPNVGEPSRQTAGAAGDGSRGPELMAVLLEGPGPGEERSRAESFARLYTSSYQPLVGLCRRLLGGSGDPEEVAQE